jgi:hypothetical protein
MEQMMNREIKIAEKVTADYQLGYTPLHFTVGLAALPRDIRKHADKIGHGAETLVRALKTEDLSDEAVSRRALLRLNALDADLDVAITELQEYRETVETVRRYVEAAGK